MRRSCAFIKFGAFSHTNARVLEQLRVGFPDLDVEVWDVAELIRAKRSTWIGLHAHAIGEYGRDLLQGRKRLATTRWLSTYAFRRIRETVRAALARRQRAFTLQTQSIFDASCPGTPHFVYTDNTLLANLQYSECERRAVLLSRRWMRREPQIYHHARRVLVMSRNVARSLREDYGLAPERIADVGVGCNSLSAEAVAAIPARATASYAAREILFVGSLWEQKGGPELVAAFRQVRRRHPEARLTIVGVSPAVAEPGVEVVGRVPLSAVNDYYRRATLFCLPTRREAFGIVFLEAMAHRLPVVGPATGALPDIIQEGRTGRVIRPDDIEGMARVLSELMADPEACNRYGAAGHELVASRYTWRAVGRRIVAAIGEATAATAPPGAAGP